MYHYVYRISNISTNMHYYGKRSSKIHPKEDLGVKYFSSSFDKQFISEQKLNPENFEYTIIAITDTEEEALELEVYLHAFYKVDKNPRFYNKARQLVTSFRTSTLGVPVTQKTAEHLRSINIKKEVKDNIVGNAKSLAQLGTKNHRAKLINIYRYSTGELLASNVVSNTWCRENKFVSYKLSSTAKRDLNKPHNGDCANREKYNPHYYQDMYAEYV